MTKVLMFHRVLPQNQITSPNAYTEFGTLISQEYLEQILCWLNENNYKIVNVSKLCNYTEDKKVIALTFDDGYVDNFEFAYPVLKKHKATATFFPLVCTSKNNSVLPLDTYYQCVDSMNLNEDEREKFIKGSIKKEFYWTEPSKQREMLTSIFNEIPKNSRVQYMSASQLIELSNNGFEIGSHGVTHSLLTADYMTKEKQLKEMQSSKKWLESILDKKVTAYCFPAGYYNLELLELAKQVGYTSVSLISKQEKTSEVLTSYSRVFVKPNSFNELKVQLDAEL
ncbi:MAG TPA: polysaccharide deacetylase family protein [Brumimicrobium sp.]|nr:polysaccharide deacetylase family protein [Brumimicrobium sp.]